MKIITYEARRVVGFSRYFHAHNRFLHVQKRHLRRRANLPYFKGLRIRKKNENLSTQTLNTNTFKSSRVSCYLEYISLCNYCEIKPFRASKNYLDFSTMTKLFVNIEKKNKSNVTAANVFFFFFYGANLNI